MNNANGRYQPSSGQDAVGLGFRRGPAWLTLLLGLLGLGAITWIALSAWLDRELDFPNVSAVFWAASWAGVSTLASARGWSALLDDPGESSYHTVGYLIAQVARYFPGGGLVQASSQVALARPRVQGSRAGVLYFVQAGLHLAVAVVIGGGLYGLTRTDVWWITPLMVVVVVGTIIALGRMVPRASRRLHKLQWLAFLQSGSVRRASLVRAAVWAAMSILAAGISWWGVLRALEADSRFLESISIFALAWAVGFVAIPFPAGAGVREAAMLVLASASPAVIAASSVLQRIAAITVNAALATGAYLLYLRHRRSSKSFGERSWWRSDSDGGSDR